MADSIMKATPQIYIKNYLLLHSYQRLTKSIKHTSKVAKYAILKTKYKIDLYMLQCNT